MKTAGFRLILCATILLYAACSDEGRFERSRGRLYVQEDGEAIEVRGPDGNVLIRGNQKSAAIMLKTEEGETAVLGIDTEKLAPDFPADIPVLPESSVVMSQVFQGGLNAIATITTRQPSEDVIRFYEEQIASKGWQPGSRFTLDNMVMLNGKRGAANLNVSITTDADLITINMARTESAPQ